MHGIVAVLNAPLQLAAASFLMDVEGALARNGIQAAVSRHDTASIFDWLISLIQLQGISDRAAFEFSDRHGLPAAADLRQHLASARCVRLTSFWHFAECGYRRSGGSCSEPALRPSCGVHAIPARNGRLAQSAFSLALFIRDHCDGDIVGWTDRRLADADCGPAAGRARQMREAVVQPLTEVFGISSKVVSMAMADLLLGGDPGRARWVQTGAAMIAIDSLVHNFLHRTGLANHFGHAHRYGDACYSPGGCADTVEHLAADIDARQFGSQNPPYFPRLIQFAIWSFCAESGSNICNGNQIDDDRSCDQKFCPAGIGCMRVPLRSRKPGGFAQS